MSDLYYKKKYLKYKIKYLELSKKIKYGGEGDENNENNENVSPNIKSTPLTKTIGKYVPPQRRNVDLTELKTPKDNTPYKGLYNPLKPVIIPSRKIDSTSISVNVPLKAAHTPSILIDVPSKAAHAPLISFNVTSKKLLQPEGKWERDVSVDYVNAQKILEKKEILEKIIVEMSNKETIIPILVENFDRKSETPLLPNEYLNKDKLCIIFNSPDIRRICRYNDFGCELSDNGDCYLQLFKTYKDKNDIFQKFYIGHISVHKGESTSFITDLHYKSDIEVEGQQFAIIIGIIKNNNNIKFIFKENNTGFITKDNRFDILETRYGLLGQQIRNINIDILNYLNNLNDPELLLYRL